VQASVQALVLESVQASVLVTEIVSVEPNCKSK
jgi:hypothetical protein